MTTPNPAEFVMVGREPTEAMVHAICRATGTHGRKVETCQQCPASTEHPTYGPCAQACYAMARDGWRKSVAAAPTSPVMAAGVTDAQVEAVAHAFWSRDPEGRTWDQFRQTNAGRVLLSDMRAALSPLLAQLDALSGEVGRLRDVERRAKERMGVGDDTEMNSAYWVCRKMAKLEAAESERDTLRTKWNDQAVFLLAEMERLRADRDDLANRLHRERELCEVNSDIVDDVREALGLKDKPGCVVEAAAALRAKLEAAEALLREARDYVSIAVSEESTVSKSLRVPRTTEARFLARIDAAIAGEPGATKDMQHEK
jgi:hypothetical protein